jgi:Transglycosylase SLT domain
MSGIGNTYTTAQLQDIAVQAANTYGVPQNLFQQLVTTESNWQPAVVSPKGAVGLGQLLPSTASGLSYNGSTVDPYDPTSNLYGSAEYLSQLYSEFGSWAAAVSAYNTGPANYAAGVQPAANYAPVVGLAQQIDQGNINAGGGTLAVGSTDPFYIPGTDSPIATDTGGEGIYVDPMGNVVGNALPGATLTDVTGTTAPASANIYAKASGVWEQIQAWITGVAGRVGLFVLAIVIILTALIIYGIQSNRKEIVEAAKTVA